MARTATKTSNIYSRVDPETKNQAELILDRLGIPMSNAIDMFLKQVVIHRGIPFEMKLPASTPLSISTLSKDQFDVEMQKGMDDISEGNLISISSVEDEMRKLYGI